MTIPAADPFLVVEYSSTQLQMSAVLLARIGAYPNLTLKQLGVHEDLCLTGIADPYSAAIAHLPKLNEAVEPEAKLKCVVQVARIICNCVDEYSTTRNGSAAGIVISADDLLLLFIFIVVKTAMPNLVAHLEFINDYMDHRTSVMDGYYIATAQAAVEAILGNELVLAENGANGQQSAHVDDSNGHAE